MHHVKTSLTFETTIQNTETCHPHHI